MRRCNRFYLELWWAKTSQRERERKREIDEEIAEKKHKIVYWGIGFIFYLSNRRKICDYMAQVYIKSIQSFCSNKQVGQSVDKEEQRFFS